MVQFALTILLPLTSLRPARASCLSLFPLLLAPQAFRTRLLSPLYPSEDIWFGDGVICVQKGERELGQDTCLPVHYTGAETPEEQKPKPRHRQRPRCYDSALPRETSIS